MMSEESESESRSSSAAELEEEDNLENLKPKTIIPVNNVAGLQKKLQEIKLNLNWVEKLDITTEFAFGKKQKMDPDSNDMTENKAEHDFQREMAFINQAKSSASAAISRLKKLGIPTKRPSDYFAEMAKSDEHMTKVRQKLMSKEVALERSEKARELREQRKHAKKIQREIIQKKQSEKKAFMEALKKSKKGKFDVSKILEEKKQQQPGHRNPKAQQRTEDKQSRKSKRKQKYKNDKYGYGGKKKGSKYNTADSAAFLPGMDKKKFSLGKFHGKHSVQGGKGRPRAKSTRRRR